jgi:hypothetical protein
VPSPAFIVEGDMEQRILGRICKGQPVRRIGCNGDDVPIERVCEFIGAQIKTLNNRHYPIFVVFDREKRSASVDQITAQVSAELAKLGYGHLDIRVFIADREFEDWYLIDRARICENFEIEDTYGPLSGKGGLEKLMSSYIRYHETTVGVDLFFLVSHREIAEKCATYQRLVNNALEVECRYFQEYFEFRLDV